MRGEILAAAAEALFESGLAGFTFERIAQAAGASKTTLYKWWTSPGRLAAEAYFEHVRVELDFPTTEDPVADIRTQLRVWVNLMTHERAGQVLRDLIGAGQSDPDLRAAVAERYSRPRREEAVRALQRVRDLGIIDPNTSLHMLVSQLWGACYQYILVLDEVPDASVIDELVDNALHLPPSTGGRGTG